MKKIYPYRKQLVYEGEVIDVKASSEEELYDKIRKRKEEIVTGRKIFSSTTTVRQWSSTWLETYIRDDVSNGTYKDYLTRMRRHILPEIGHRRVKDVRDIHCQKALNKMRGHSKDQINKVKRDMYRMFKKAQKNNMIIFNPAEDLDTPKAKDGKRRAITDEERSLILSVAKTEPQGLWIKTMLYCGFRPGETDRLRAKHIDYKNGYIFIDGTKTENAKRWVPVPDELLFQFKALNKTGNEYIFTNSFGDPTSASSRDLSWRKFKTKLQLVAGASYNNMQELLPPEGMDLLPVTEDLVPYCFRHTFATDCKDALIPDSIRKELLGHADQDVTDHYSHRTTRSLQIAKELLEKYREEHCHDFVYKNVQ